MILIQFWSPEVKQAFKFTILTDKDAVEKKSLIGVSREGRWRSQMLMKKSFRAEVARGLLGISNDPGPMCFLHPARG